MLKKLTLIAIAAIGATSVSGFMVEKKDTPPASVPVAVELTEGELTIWDNVFSQEQADSGKALYTQYCATCHGPTGRGTNGGTALTGVGLYDNWEGTTLLDMVTFAHGAMPPGNAGGIGSEQDYLNIITYVMKLHGAKPGEVTLTYDEEALGNIFIVKKPK